MKRNLQTDKIPPQALEAEESILSAAMLGAADEICEIIKADEFYNTRNQIIMRTIHNLSKSGINVDLITVKDKLSESKLLEKVGGIAYVSSLVTTVPASISLRSHVKLIKEASKKRRIIETCLNAIAQCYDSSKSSEIITNIDVQLSNIDSGISKLVKYGDLVQPGMDELERRRKTDGPVGIPCGLTDIDKMLGGFHGGKLYVIGARPAMGKSAFGMRLLRGAAKKGYPGAFYSLEMPRDEVLFRELSCESHVDGNRLTSGEIENEHWSKLSNAAETVYELPIWIDDNPNVEINDLKSSIRQFHRWNGRCLIVVDYLQYIKGLKSERQDIEIGTITSGLKKAAKISNVPIVLIAQLNRELEKRPDKHPQISDLRGSGEIEQDADVIAFLYRDEVYYENTEHKGICEFIVRKNRGGPLGTVFLTWIAHRTSFESIAYRR